MAMMLVVGCHPDTGTSQFVEAVPHLFEEAKALMKMLPFKEVGCGGGTSQPVSICADVQAQDWNGESPLHHAALNEDVELVRYLVCAGADP